MDNFKQVNDWHAYDVGDQLRKAFSNRLASQFRPDNVVCRWGGDEFLAVISCTLPDALGKASLAAERVSGQYAMESANGAENICVSAAVGVAQHEPGESAQELFASADALLYLRYRSWLDETGAPLAVQKELMRPASIQATMNIGGKAMTDSQRQAHSRVWRWS